MKFKLNFEEAKFEHVSFYCTIDYYTINFRSYNSLLFIQPILQFIIIIQ